LLIDCGSWILAFGADRTRGIGGKINGKGCRE
jgi:hypothetical protein